MDEAHLVVASKQRYQNSLLNEYYIFRLAGARETVVSPPSDYTHCMSFSLELFVPNPAFNSSKRRHLLATNKKP